MLLAATVAEKDNFIRAIDDKLSGVFKPLYQTAGRRPGQKSPASWKR